MTFVGYENALGLFAFLSVLLFLIITLRKPRAREVHVPTLMFFDKRLHAKSERSFLRKIPLNLLFLLQLLTLLLLSLFFIKPYLVVGYDSAKENVVLVLDTSGSMSVNNAFEQARTLAQKRVGAKNTIIAAGGVPSLVLQEGSASDAKKSIKRMRAGATDSPLGDALLFAGDYLEGEQPVVFVVSDFYSTHGTPLSVAQQALENKGAQVLFLPVDNRIEGNVGFVGASFTPDEVRISVKNYGEATTVSVQTPEGIQKVDLGSGETRVVTYPLAFGKQQVSLLEEDSFPLDNEAYFVVPEEERVRVLLISDEPSKYIIAALNARESIDLEVSPSSTVPSDDYDAYLLDHLSPQNVEPATIAAVLQAAENGAGVIIVAQRESSRIPYGSLLPLTLGDAKGSTDVALEQENGLTRNAEFGLLSWHFATRDEQGIALARGQDGALLQISDVGKGKVIFFGVAEDAANFQLHPFFPVFWARLVEYVSALDTAEERSVPGGTLLTLPNPSLVQSPSGSSQVKSLVLFDELGTWTIGEKEYGVSLLSEKESAFERPEDLSFDLLTKESEKGVKKPVSSHALLFGLILLFGEFLILKKRGEL